MERYGRRKVYCIRLRKTNMVFPSLASFLFHMSTIYCYFLSFSSASHLSLTLAQTFCDKEKEEETVECLGNEKKTVFMVRREERNKFSPCPLWRQKKTFSSPSIRPSVQYVFFGPVGRWETVTSRRVEMNNKYAAALSCDSPFFTVLLVWKRVMCVRVKGNSFQINKSCAAEYYVIFADPEHSSNFGSLPSR